MKVAIIGSSLDFYPNSRIVSELQNRNIDFDFFEYSNFTYSSFDGLLYNNLSIDLSQFSVAVFRTAGYTSGDLPGSFRLENEINVLAHFFVQSNIPFVNDRVILRQPFYNKFTQFIDFASYNIPSPRTFHVSDNNVDHVFLIMQRHGFQFPLVIKHSSGSRGQSVFLAQSFESLGQFLSDKRNINLVYQEFIPNTEDYRVICIDGKSLGVMRRSGNGDWRNNFSLGGTVEVYRDCEMESFAEDVCVKLGYDNAGVDLIKYNDQYHVLEVNLTPNFEGFEKALNVNVAAHFVDMLQRKSR